MHSTAKDAEIHVTRLGLFANLIMAIGKGVAGYSFHSQSLLTGGFHSLTDLFADLIILATISWPSSRTTTTYARNHWYGEIKMETLVALVVSSLLFFGGVAMGSTSLASLLTLTFNPKNDPARGGGTEVPDLSAAWVAAASILVKEWLYQSTIKVAKEQKSALLASNAMHHRIDSLTSIIALLTIGCTNVFGRAAWCDPVGGLVIASMVVSAGWENTRQAWHALWDTQRKGFEKLE